MQRPRSGDDGVAGVPVHARADRLRQAGGRGGHRRGDRHRHDDAAALRLRLRLRRGAAGDAVRQPGPGARVRVEPARAAADGQRARRREAAARRPVHRRRRRWSAASPTRCCRPARSCTHARRIAERFNALPPGAVRETKRLLRRAAPTARAARRSASKASSSASGCAAPRRRKPSGLLPEAQARLLEVLTVPPRSAAAPRALALKLALAPLLVAQAVATRRRAPVLPEAAGRARRRASATARPALRLLIAGDSSAAGVGVARQEQALVGHLARALHRATGAPRRTGRCAPAPA